MGSRSYLAQEIQNAATLLATDPALAERKARDLARLATNDPRILLILGSARRRQGDAAAARRVLEPLARAHPRAANTQYELGATLAALGERHGAISALRQATALNNDLVDAWRLLGEQLFIEGDVDGADHAYAGHDCAAVRDPRLKPAGQAIFRGDLAKAEQELRRFLSASPNHPEGLRMLGELSARFGRFADAETLLDHALTLAPEASGVRFSLASAQFRQQKAAEALANVEHLLARYPADPAYRNLLAACLALIGEHDRVLEIYNELLTKYDRQPGLWLNYGHALRTVGRLDDAVAAYRRCLALAPGHGEAFWGLANLKVTLFTDADRAEMLTQAARPGLSDDDRLHLHYALGKAFEDDGAYAASFQHYQAGAAVRRAQTPYDPSETTRFTKRSKAVFTPGFFADRQGVGAPSTAPIFIVGLPRAGSTLIEQILSSHSQVEGTMELPNIHLLASSLGRLETSALEPRYPEILEEMAPEAFVALGIRYLEEIRIYRKTDRPFFIDKMPNNFQHIGLIHLILPNAKIIDARRHPMASCFSAFKQHFNQGQSFSYDLTDVGLFYRDYVTLMDHFDEIPHNGIHRVIYEDMIQNSESQIRSLLRYCGLPFEESCLRFYENKRAVRTVSSEQVRRPIFRDGLDQWRHYEDDLEPLVRALGDTLNSWRGAVSPTATCLHAGVGGPTPP